MQFYQRVRDLREDNDKKQEEIAELLETTRPQYSRYERGERELPMHHFVTLARYYNVSLDYLAGLIETPRPLRGYTYTESRELTAKQKRLLSVYENNPKLKAVIDQLLELSEGS